jgi:hypothetical protein
VDRLEDDITGDVLLRARGEGASCWGHRERGRGGRRAGVTVMPGLVGGLDGKAVEGEGEEHL